MTKECIGTSDVGGQCDAVERRAQVGANDLCWAITVGGISAVLFAALLSFARLFAATLLLIFAGILLGVALNAMTELLGRIIKLAQPRRLVMVCLALALPLIAIAKVVIDYCKTEGVAAA